MQKCSFSVIGREQELGEIIDLSINSLWFIKRC